MQVTIPCVRPGTSRRSGQNPGDTIASGQLLDCRSRLVVLDACFEPLADARRQPARRCRATLRPGVRPCRRCRPCRLSVWSALARAGCRTLCPLTTACAWTDCFDPGCRTFLTLLGGRLARRRPRCCCCRCPSAARSAATGGPFPAVRRPRVRRGRASATAPGSWPCLTLLTIAGGTAARVCAAAA